MYQFKNISEISDEELPSSVNGADSIRHFVDEGDREETIQAEPLNAFETDDSFQRAGTWQHSNGEEDPSDDKPVNYLNDLEKFYVTDAHVQEVSGAELIWRDIIAMSHVSVWCAPGNGGKTTLARFAAAELAASGFAVYFFQEDAGVSDLAMLHQHAKDSGYRLLNSTMNQSSVEDEMDTLRKLAQSDKDLSKQVMFFDTLKKFTPIIDKTAAGGFLTLMRKLTLRGATVVLLGHNNKYEGQDGKPIFEGVGDVRNDVDELFYIESGEKDTSGVVNLTITPDKMRCFAKPSSFKLDTKGLTISPIEDVVDISQAASINKQRATDEPVIRFILNVLSTGEINITKLVGLVNDFGVGANKSRDVINRYCAKDEQDTTALWIDRRDRANNNARMISLHPSAAHAW